MVMLDMANNGKEKLWQAKLEKSGIKDIYSTLQDQLESYCTRFPAHKERSIDPDPYCTNRGNTKYDPDGVYVSWKDSDPHSELLLAHELLHYTIVLEGGTLPVLLEHASSDAQYVHYWLFSGLTHHPLVKHRLCQFSYCEEMVAASLPVKSPGEMPGQGQVLSWDPRFWLLTRIDQRLFVFDGATEFDRVIQPLIDDSGLKDLYNAICFPPRDPTVDYINDLSQQVISHYGMQSQIEMVGLEDYIRRKPES